MKSGFINVSYYTNNIFNKYIYEKELRDISY